MAEGRSHQAIRERLLLSPTTVEAYVHIVLARWTCSRPPTAHRRVLAVLAHLRA